MKYGLFLLVIFLFSCENKNLDQKIIDDKEKLVIELNKMVKDDQYHRSLLNDFKNSDDKTPVDKKKYDSIWEIQSSFDFKNTKRLIEITRKYGFPNPDRLETNLSTWLIFQHAPSQFFQELEKLLKEEHDAGRLYANEYGLIKWHLNGREGLPFIEGVQVKDSRQINRPTYDETK